MKCDDIESALRAIVCQMAVGQQVSVFDVVTLLIIPAALGLVTLAVAIASWRVANGSFALSVAIHAEGQERARVSQHREIADDIYRWLALLWTSDHEGLAGISARSAEFGRLRSALVQSGFSGSEPLAHALEIFWRAEVPNSPLRRAYVTGAYSGLADATISLWLKNPTELHSQVKELPAMLKDMRRAGKKHEKRVKRKFFKNWDKEHRAAAGSAPAALDGVETTAGDGKGLD